MNQRFISKLNNQPRQKSSVARRIPSHACCMHLGRCGKRLHILALCLYFASPSSGVQISVHNGGKGEPPSYGFRLAYYVRTHVQYFMDLQPCTEKAVCLASTSLGILAKNRWLRKLFRSPNRLKLGDGLAQWNQLALGLCGGVISVSDVDRLALHFLCPDNKDEIVL